MMNPAYFETRFRLDGAAPAWPAEFAIVSAWATTGEQWPRARNEAADAALQAELRRRARWAVRITGYSPVSEHAEPSWATALSFDEAHDLGARFLQDAIYWVAGDELSVSLCRGPRRTARVAAFSERLDVG